MRPTRRTFLTAAGLAGLVPALSALGACSSGGDQVDFTATQVDPPFSVRPTALRAADGSRFSLADDLDSRLTLLFFGYTHCPDICPMVLASIASGLTRLPARDRDQVGVLFVTTDPARDTPAVMEDYLARFDPGFRGLTGSLGAIAGVAKSVGIYVDEGGGANATTIADPGAHGTYVLGLQPDGTAPVFWHEDTSPSQYAEDIHVLLR